MMKIDWIGLAITGGVGLGLGLLFAWLTGDETMWQAAIAGIVAGLVLPLAYEGATWALAEAPAAAAAAKPA